MLTKSLPGGEKRSRFTSYVLHYLTWIILQWIMLIWNHWNQLFCEYKFWLEWLFSWSWNTSLVCNPIMCIIGLRGVFKSTELFVRTSAGTCTTRCCLWHQNTHLWIHYLYIILSLTVIFIIVVILLSVCNQPLYYLKYFRPNACGFECLNQVPFW